MVLPTMSAVAGTTHRSVFAELQTRIDAHRAAGGDLVPLHIGDTHLPPPPGAVEALRLRAEGSSPDLSVYGTVPGLPELGRAVVERARRRGIPDLVDERNAHIGVGATHALWCAARALLDPGDEVLVAAPYWPLFPGVVKMCNAVPVEVSLPGALAREPGLDITATLEAHRTPRTKALYFVSPNNPDGTVYTRPQLETIAAFAERHNLWVFADEVYADFVYDGEHVSIAALPGAGSRTVTAGSLSKSHGLAGARIGHVVAGEAVIEAMRRTSSYSVYNVPVLMQRAALGAMQDDAAWLRDAKRAYREARDATVGALEALGLEVHRPAGGAYVFVDLHETLERVAMKTLLERCVDAGVLIAPGAAFGAAFASCVRICFTGAPLPVVAEGLTRLGGVLANV